METQAALPRIPRQDPSVGLRLTGATDEALARLAGRGSERAFGALYHRYHQSLYRYCRSIVRDESDAQDALQSVFAAALVALRRSQRDAPVRPWLFRIAHNESVSLLRRRRPHDELSEAFTGTAASPEEKIAGREHVSLLFADLGALPEQQRYALVMRELSGLRYDEIALAMGVPTEAVKQMIFRARRGLVEFREGRETSCEEICQKLSSQDRRQLRNLRLQSHLRHCSTCAAFSAAIPARQAEMRALTPMLPAGAAAGILQQALSAGNASLSLGGSGLALTGAGQAITGALSTKIAGIAVVATATVTAATAWQQLLPVAAHRPAQHGTVARETGSRPPAVLPSPAAQNAVVRGAARTPQNGQTPGVRVPGPRSGSGSSTPSGSPAAARPATAAAPGTLGARQARHSPLNATPLGNTPTAANSVVNTSPLLGGSSTPSGSAPRPAGQPGASQTAMSDAPAGGPSGDPEQHPAGEVPAPSGPSLPKTPVEAPAPVSPVAAH